MYPAQYLFRPWLVPQGTLLTAAHSHLVLRQHPGYWCNVQASQLGLKLGPVLLNVSAGALEEIAYRLFGLTLLARLGSLLRTRDLWSVLSQGSKLSYSCVHSC